MDIRVSNPSKAGLPVTMAAVKSAVRAFCRKGHMPLASISIVFLSAKDMRRLNRQALGHDHVTDVITFDLRDNKSGNIDGEIYVCPAEARRNARIYTEPAGRELLRYVAHGILHLYGYDDATLKQRLVMRQQEDEMLSWLSSPRKL